MEIETVHSPASSFRFQVVDSEHSPTSPSTPKGFGNPSLFFSMSTPATPAHQYAGFDQPTSSCKSPEFSRNRKTSLWKPFSPRSWKKSSTVPEPKTRHRAGMGLTMPSKSSKREARSLSPEKRIRWRFKDLFLFRSASEGRRSDKDPFNKYYYWHTKTSPDSSPVNAPKCNKRGHLASPHELHYKTNKAMSEDMRKKSFLPYKQGILGPLAVNPLADHHHPFGYTTR